jgi:hypothetical protein
VALGYVTRNSRGTGDVSPALQIGLAIGQRDSGQVPGPSVSSAGSLSSEEQRQWTVKEAGLMDEHIIEIDQIEDGHVVLVVPSLRLIVMGRTLEEARAWARSAIGYRGLLTVQREEPLTATNEVTRPPSSNAA